MSQTFTPTLAGTDFANQALKTTIPNNFAALRSMFSGTSAPSSPVAGQLWYDTTNGMVKQWNGAAWTMLLPANARAAYIDAGVQLAAVSATTAIAFFSAPAPAKIEAIRLISDTASTSSSGNEWQFALRNVTAGVELFSGTVGNFTALGGVGGGAEFAVDTTYRLVTNQNQSILANAVMRLTLTKVGSVTTLAKLVARLEGYYTGV